jgi:hypothetical protein
MKFAGDLSDAFSCMKALFCNTCAKSCYACKLCLKLIFVKMAAWSSFMQCMKTFALWRLDGRPVKSNKDFSMHDS